MTTPSPTYTKTFEAAVSCLTRGFVLGKTYSVGTYKTAVEPTVWAVLDRTGDPVLASEDLFTCCELFGALETVKSAEDSVEAFIRRTE